jgi:hypothetical protein
MAANDLVFCETTYSEISIHSIHCLGSPSYPMSISRWPDCRDLAHRQRAHIINPIDRPLIKTLEAFQICSCRAAGVQKLKSRSTEQIFPSSIPPPTLLLLLHQYFSDMMHLFPCFILVISRCFRNSPMLRSVVGKFGRPRMAMD